MARMPRTSCWDYDAEHRDWAFVMPDRRKGWAMGDETVFAGLRPVPRRWIHLAAVHDPAGRCVCLYVDGSLEACRPRASLTRANGPLDIGRALQDGEPADGWHGAVDDVRIFPAVLNQAQVREVAGHRA
jgi:Concanavalin A-like lectin/glucanases superfamily